MAAGKDPKVFELSVVRGELDEGERTIRVTEGDVVELHWSSDEEIELHMHGYNVELAVGPGSRKIMRLNTTKAGRFAILNHDGSPPNVLVYLEVAPK